MHSKNGIMMFTRWAYESFTYRRDTLLTKCHSYFKKTSHKVLQIFLNIDPSAFYCFKRKAKGYFSKLLWGRG